MATAASHLLEFNSLPFPAQLPHQLQSAMSYIMAGHCKLMMNMVAQKVQITVRMAAHAAPLVLIVEL